MYEFEELDPGGDEETEPQTGFNAAADKAIAETLGPGPKDQPQESDDDDSYMDEVDKRLEITNYYRELLRGSLFGQNTEAAQTVEREVRRFVRQRIEILLGIRPAAEKQAAVAPFPFSDSEVMALRMFAERLLATPAAVKAEPATPELRKASAPPMKQAPSLNRRAAPFPPSQLAAVAKKKPEPPKAAAKTDNAAAPLEIEKQVAHPETGEMVKIKTQRVQRPAGQLPFPTTSAEMEMLTAQQSQQSVSLSMRKGIL